MNRLLFAIIYRKLTITGYRRYGYRDKFYRHPIAMHLCKLLSIILEKSLQISSVIDIQLLQTLLNSLSLTGTFLTTTYSMLLSEQKQLLMRIADGVLGF